MRAIVFGASGGTGTCLVQQALEASFEVTAFVRDPRKLNVVHPRLRVFKGDVLSANLVSEAMKGQQVVLCALGFGPSHDRHDLVHSVGTRHILEAMKEFHVRRIICETTVLAGEAARFLSATGKLYRMVMNVLNPHFLREKERQEQLIMASGLDWTIVRPVTLTNGPRTTSYETGVNLHSDSSSRVSREDVASFMLQQVTSPVYLHQAPIIRY